MPRSPPVGSEIRQAMIAYRQGAGPSCGKTILNLSVSG
jgi:hypothetical protein